MNHALTPEELELEIGGSVRTLRLQKNLPQSSLAEHAGISLSALRHLEAGQRANLTTLIRVARALGKEDWLRNLAPQISINPLYMGRDYGPRRRARQRRSLSK